MFDYVVCMFVFFVFKQKTAYEMRISDWSSDVCSSDLPKPFVHFCLSLLDQTPILISLALSAPELLAHGRRDVAPILLHHDPALLLGRRFCQIGRASCRERVCQYV